MIQPTSLTQGSAYQRLGIASPKPHAYFPFTTLLLPFTQEVWYCILASMFICSIASYGLIRLAPKSDVAASQWHTISSALFFFFATSTGENLHLDTKMPLQKVRYRRNAHAQRVVKQFQILLPIGSSSVVARCCAHPSWHLWWYFKIQVDESPPTNANRDSKTNSR